MLVEGLPGSSRCFHIDLPHLFSSVLTSFSIWPHGRATHHTELPARVMVVTCSMSLERPWRRYTFLLRWGGMQELVSGDVLKGHRVVHGGQESVAPRYDLLMVCQGLFTIKQ